MTRRSSPSAYTVFRADGSPRRNRVGLVVFTRRLRDAVRQAEAGDTITGWANAGYALARYSANGRRLNDDR